MLPGDVAQANLAQIVRPQSCLRSAGDVSMAWCADDSANVSARLAPVGMTELHYIRFLYSTFVACTVHSLLVQYIRCLYSTFVACTLHSLLVQYIRCLYSTFVACTLHSLCVQYIRCL